MLRVLFIASGLAAIGLMTYMAIEKAGGIEGEAAPSLIAMALVMCVGASAIGAAVAHKRRGIAVIITFGMLALEGAAMLNTAQRVAGAREATREPLLQEQAKHRTAVAQLETARAEKPRTADRSELEAAQTAYNAASAELSRPNRSGEECRQSCRDGRKAAVAAAQVQVVRAQTNIALFEREEIARIERSITEAQSRADATQEDVSSATPLADALHVEQWVLDLVEASLIAFGSNIPASALIALGLAMGHKPESSEAARLQVATVSRDAVTLANGYGSAKIAGETARARPERLTHQSPAASHRVAVKKPSKALPSRAQLDAVRFSREQIMIGVGSVPVNDLYLAYRAWSRARGETPQPASEMAAAFGSVLQAVDAEMSNGQIIGVSLRSAEAV